MVIVERTCPGKQHWPDDHDDNDDGVCCGGGDHSAFIIIICLICIIFNIVETISKVVKFPDFHLNISALFSGKSPWLWKGLDLKIARISILQIWMQTKVGNWGWSYNKRPIFTNHWHTNISNILALSSSYHHHNMTPWGDLWNHRPIRRRLWGSLYHQLNLVGWKIKFTFPFFKNSLFQLNLIEWKIKFTFTFFQKLSLPIETDRLDN